MKRRYSRKYDGKKQEWLRLAVLLVIMLIAAFAVFHIVFGVATVSGGSMEPGFRDGDVVIYLRVGQTYHVGDIIALTMPSGESYIKRISGLPGDTIELKDGKMIRNGAQEGSFGQFGDTLSQVDTVTFPLQVGPGRYFVLGDNRKDSVDSRTFGTVAENQIQGRVIFTIKKGK